jgi:hypothetical protein
MSACVKIIVLDHELMEWVILFLFLLSSQTAWVYNNQCIKLAYLIIKMGQERPIVLLLYVNFKYNNNSAVQDISVII